MQAIREIYLASSRALTLTIPAEFLGQQVEVILLPLPVHELRRPSLLQILAGLPECEEEFPDIDEGLLPLDDVRLLV